MTEIETVNEFCKTDCVYRCLLDIQGNYFCNYCVMEQAPRGCRISECDKYRRGNKKIRIQSGTLYTIWDIDEE